jgi:hypothetical protein
MKNLIRLAALAAFVSSAFAATHISDTLTLNDGATAMAGHIYLSGPSGSTTTASSNTTITIGTSNITGLAIAAGGIDIELVGCTGCLYRAQYRLENSRGVVTTEFEERWAVPDVGDTLTRIMVQDGSLTPAGLVNQQRISGAGLAVGQIWYWTGVAWQARTFGSYLFGHGAPSDSLGFNNDLYLDLDVSCRYGPKASGVWPTPCTSEIGQTGDTGSQGAPGADGPAGVAGPAGPAGPAGGGVESPLHLAANTTAGSCSITSGPVGTSCTASATCGESSLPCLAITHNYGDSEPPQTLFKDRVTGYLVGSTVSGSPLVGITAVRVTTNDLVTITFSGAFDGSGKISSGDTGAQGLAGTNGVDGTDGIDGTGYAATSTTSLTPGTGAKTLTTQAGLAYSIGACIQVISAGAPTAYMIGPVTAYDTATGSLTFTSTATTTAACSGIGGSGAHADWNLNVGGSAGPPGATGPSQNIAATTHTLVGDGAGAAIPAEGTATDCMLVDGTSAACGGGPTFTAGYGLFYPFGRQFGTSINGTNLKATLGGSPVAAFQFVVPYAISISKLDLQVKTASGTCSGTCGLIFAIYSGDSTCSTRLGVTTPLTSGGSPDINATPGTPITATFTGTVSLSAGVYYLAWATDSTALVLQGLTNLFTSFENANGTRTARFTNNPYTSTGSSIALPSNCSNGLSANTGYIAPMVALER